MAKYMTIAKELAVAGSILMLTARFACVAGMIGAATYFCSVAN